MTTSQNTELHCLLSDWTYFQSELEKATEQEKQDWLRRLDVTKTRIANYLATKNLKAYNVLTGEFTYTDVIDAYIGGPSYDERDWVMVLAKNKQDAKGKAVKALRTLKSEIFRSFENPFFGMKAEQVKDWPGSAPDPNNPEDEGSKPYSIEQSIVDANDCGRFFDFYSETTP